LGTLTRFLTLSQEKSRNAEKCLDLDSGSESKSLSNSNYRINFVEELFENSFDFLKFSKKLKKNFFRRV